MVDQFVFCPACGAKGQAGKNCEYCGTIIHTQCGQSASLLKDGPSTQKPTIVKEMSASPEEYARRISVYQKIETDPVTPLASKVYIGKKVGIINLNGELVIPLQDDTSIPILDDYFTYFPPKSKPVREYEYFLPTNLGPYAPGRLVDLKTMEEFDNVVMNSLTTKVEFIVPDNAKRYPNSSKNVFVKLLNKEEVAVESRRRFDKDQAIRAEMDREFEAFRAQKKKEKRADAFKFACMSGGLFAVLFYYMFGILGELGVASGILISVITFIVIFLIVFIFQIVAE